jgi:hypothetical protein
MKTPSSEKAPSMATKSNGRKCVMKQLRGLRCARFPDSDWNNAREMSEKKKVKGLDDNLLHFTSISAALNARECLQPNQLFYWLMRWRIFADMKLKLNLSRIKSGIFAQMYSSNIALL